MTDRTALATAFLDRTEWAGVPRGLLAGDASNRRYERLTRADGETAVLMDAPPEKGEDIAPFVHIAGYLCDIGLSAPRIMAQDNEHGFLLIEDLGDDLFARILERQPEIEKPLYETATDVLVTLHRARMPRLERYDAPLMTELAALAFTKYQNATIGLDNDALTRFEQRFEDVLLQNLHGPDVLIQRDYHAENLLWLPDRTGVARVGLLDFQDAMAGHCAYDLVSLLQDARRDVPPGLQEQMIRRYIAATGMDDHTYRTAYAVLGAQRNLRILGVFARLGTEYGKPHYIDLIPRVWAHLERDLDHPALAPVADLILTALPAPGPDILARLKSA